MDFAIGTVGEPIRGLVMGASRANFVLASLRAGEIAFPFARDLDDPANNRRIVTEEDAGQALQGPAYLPGAGQ